MQSAMDDRDEIVLLRALLRAVDYGVLLSNAERRDIVCNRRFCELFGLDDAAVLASSPEQVRAMVLPRLADPKEFVSALDDAYANPGVTREDEVALTSPRPRLLRRYTAPVHDTQGRVIGRLWTFLDITQTRQLERKVQAQAAQLRVQARQLSASLKTVSGRLHKVESTLSQTQQQLFESEKLSAIGLLAASTAHDIRNILTPLTIEITLADQDEAGARGESLQVIRQQVDRLVLMTHHLLSLAKPAASECAPLDFTTLAERVLTLLRPLAGVDGVLVTLHAPSSLPRVTADPVQIEQVFVNLVLNGVQAMQATGGTLTLRLSPRAQTGCKGVVLQVADTGPGIPPAARRRLFDPFYTTRPDGAGLGLFSCRRIVEDHGGTIRVRSQVGQGTCVTVWLPEAPCAPEDN